MKRLSLSPALRLVVALIFAAALQRACAEGDDQLVTDPAARQKILQDLTETYRGTVEAAFKPIVRFSPPQYRERLSHARIEVVPDDPAFGFFGGPSDQGDMIKVTVGGLRSLDECCLAVAISPDFLKEPKWFLNYFLYLRSFFFHPSGVAVDPLRAAGYRPGDVPTSVNQKESWLFTSCLAFILAHEAGHVALQHRTAYLPGESRSERLARLRTQEAAADHYALNVLTEMNAPPTGAIFVQLCHLLIFQRTVDADSGADHPADHQRLAAIGKYAREHISQYDLQGQSRDEFLGWFDSAEKTSAQIDSGDLSLADLDKQARGVSLSSLRRNPR